MNFLSAWLESRSKKKRVEKIKQAFSIIEAEGLVVCNMQQRAGTNYLVDGKGNWHKIGKRV